ncbi:MAG TPA: chemotaxis protein CheX [Acidimicrobiales bacterium]|nr:chemotaxis protein CheX [Acidimicrobiales bacterium]
MLVLEDDLTALTGGVWEAFLGLTAEPVPPDDAVVGSCYSSCVHISGAWEGSVNLVLPEPLARTVAAAMFDLPPSDVSAEDLTDAVGELANIIGGNVKGMIDEPCELSLPVVAAGPGISLSIPGAEVLQSVTLSSGGHAFQVAVHARPTPRTPRSEP